MVVRGTAVFGTSLLKFKSLTLLVDEPWSKLFNDDIKQQDHNLFYGIMRGQSDKDSNKKKLNLVSHSLFLFRGLLKFTGLILTSTASDGLDLSLIPH